mmetsp:Transcript_9021/g.22802  ORF Transcript_9021/g.22802 Transcript_9021/m.22802 type:complete len:367 (+) Transcript_9021:831-1931(+)
MPVRTKMVDRFPKLCSSRRLDDDETSRKTCRKFVVQYLVFVLLVFQSKQKSNSNLIVMKVDAFSTVSISFKTSSTPPRRPQPSKSTSSYCQTSLLSSTSIFRLLDASTALSSSRRSDANNDNDDGHDKVYYYFGYGSNVLPSTMKSLRGIQPINMTAAVLPGYKLEFYGAGGIGDSPTNTSPLPQLIESSAAFIEPVVGDESVSSSSWTSSLDVVHGVLYALSASNFARVGQTEGVPWGYRWKECFVYPYRGNGRDAGRKAMTAEGEQSTKAVKAYTLGVPRGNGNGNRNTRRLVPPSSSYLGLIQEGTRLWGMDEDYQQMLRQVPVATNLVLFGGDGVSGTALQVAEKLTSTERTFGIPPIRLES